MNTLKIKTVDIQAREYWDRPNGGMYFSAIVTLNFGMEDEKKVGVPFEYGHGDQIYFGCFQKLIKDGIITDYEEGRTPWVYCQKNGITLSKCLTEGWTENQVREYTENI